MEIDVKFILVKKIINNIKINQDIIKIKIIMINKEE